MERAMGIEPIANSLSPVESVGLTLLEDLISAQKSGVCAQVAPKFTHRPKFWARSGRSVRESNSGASPTGSFEGRCWKETAGYVSSADVPRSWRFITSASEALSGTTIRRI